jgi:hypothetical protein
VPATTVSVGTEEAANRVIDATADAERRAESAPDAGPVVKEIQQTAKGIYHDKIEGTDGTK